MYHAGFKRALFVLLPLTCILGCRDATGPLVFPARTPSAVTQLPRALTSAESTVRDASNAFSFALWNKVNAAQSRNQRLFISPLSASFALGIRQ